MEMFIFFNVVFYFGKCSTSCVPVYDFKIRQSEFSSRRIYSRQKTNLHSFYFFLFFSMRAIMAFHNFLSDVVFNKMCPFYYTNFSLFYQPFTQPCWIYYSLFRRPSFVTSVCLLSVKFIKLSSSITSPRNFRCLLLILREIALFLPIFLKLLNCAYIFLVSLESH